MIWPTVARCISRSSIRLAIGKPPRTPPLLDRWAACCQAPRERGGHARMNPLFRRASRTCASRRHVEDDTFQVADAHQTTREYSGVPAPQRSRCTIGSTSAGKTYPCARTGMAACDKYTAMPQHQRATENECFFYLMGHDVASPAGRMQRAARTTEPAQHNE